LQHEACRNYIPIWEYIKLRLRGADKAQNVQKLGHETKLEKLEAAIAKK
jgi:hypothetical protein